MSEQNKATNNKTKTKTLIESMLQCDGTRGNCEGCTFREHPDCRNAMAHHGGALIQLQEVMTRNHSAMLGKVMHERDLLEQALRQANEHMERQDERLEKLHCGLWASKHCDSCDALAAGANPELTEARCNLCREGQSQWELDKDFGAPPRVEEPDAPEKAEHVDEVTDE